MPQSIGNNSYKLGYILGMVEARASFALYLYKKRIPTFRFVIELPKTQGKALQSIKKYLSCGRIHKTPTTYIYAVFAKKDIGKFISLMDKYYPLRTQKYIIFKCWAKIFKMFSNTKITSRNYGAFHRALKFYRDLERSKDKNYRFVNKYVKHSSDFISGFVSAIIHAKGFFDYRVYKEQKSDRKYPHWQPKFNLYIVLNKSDIDLAKMIYSTLKFGKIYSAKNTIQYTLNSRNEIAGAKAFLDKYYKTKPREYEYKLWMKIFDIVQKYKPSSKKRRYLYFHKLLLKQLDSLFNSKKRLHMNEKNFSSMRAIINALIRRFEKKHLFADSSEC